MTFSPSKRYRPTYKWQELSCRHSRNAWSFLRREGEAQRVNLILCMIIQNQHRVKIHLLVLFPFHPSSNFFIRISFDLFSKTKFSQLSFLLCLLHISYYLYKLHKRRSQMIAMATRYKSKSEPMKNCNFHHFFFLFSLLLSLLIFHMSIFDKMHHVMQDPITFITVLRYKV